MRNLLLAVSALALTAAAPYPDRQGHAVVDAANVIPDDAERMLNNRIVAWDKATGHQLVVATVPSLGGREIADYGVGLFRDWQLGRKGVNDGVLLTIAPTEHKVRIDVGYGLEPTLTDALTSQIVRENIVPLLKAKDFAGAATAGAEQIMANARTDKAQEMSVVDKPKHGGWRWLIGIFGVLAFAGGSILLIMRKMAHEERERERERAEAAEEAARRTRREALSKPPRKSVTTGGFYSPPYRPTPASVRDTYVPPAAPVPVYVAPPSPPSRDDSYSSTSSWGDSSSSDSSSSFDSGGGSCGGGGSDSSW